MLTINQIEEEAESVIAFAEDKEFKEIDMFLFPYPADSEITKMVRSKHEHSYIPQENLFLFFMEIYKEDDWYRSYDEDDQLMKLKSVWSFDLDKKYLIGNNFSPLLFFFISKNYYSILKVLA